MKKKRGAFCSKCGRELDVFDRQSGLTEDRIMGFGSAHDGERFFVRLCCACTDEIGEMCGAFAESEDEADDDE